MDMTRIKRQILRQIRGGQVKGNSDPPMFVRNPWNSLVLDFEGLLDPVTDVLQVQCTELIRAQLFFPSGTNLEWRPVRIDAYGPVDSSASLTLAVFDPIGSGATGGEVIANLKDEGTLARRPSCHYVYGDAYNHACLSRGAEKVFEVLNPGVVRLHVLWRTRAAAA